MVWFELLIFYEQGILIGEINQIIVVFKVYRYSMIFFR